MLLILSLLRRAIAKERFKSRASSLYYQRLQIKICEKCFVCHSIVSCHFCLQCTKCCPKSSCRGQTSKLLGNLARPGSRTQNNPKLEGRLYPPLPEPTQTHKISDSHKLLCQSPQEQLPVGGIASAYRQKCNRVGPKSNLTGVFQQTFPSSQTQQQMEAHFGSEQTKPLPQSGEIQDGNTGNHQNFPPTRGVGHLSRLQRCLLPHTNTGTIQEIPQISYPGPELPIQGTALWSVHSPHGIYSSSERGETDGLTQGYKDPPVPRRLVSQSQIPPNLSPSHPNSGQDVPGSGLAGELRKIRTGAQTSLQLRRLPVRPQVRPGQTDTGPVAKSSRKNTNTAVSTGLSGPTVHVLDRSVNCHRETSSPRPVAHETHTVASQEQLEGTGISREGHSSTQIPAPTLTMVAKRKQCAPRSTITPHKACSANFYRRIKRRVGRSLKRAHCKGVLVSAGKQAAHNLCTNQIVLVATDNTTVVAYINKEGGMKSGPLCALLWRILTWCSQRQVTLKARHIPGRLNVIADKLSRLNQTIQTEWSLLPDVFQRLCSKWHRPQIGLFATRFNHKLPLFVSPVPDTLAVAVDALTLPWGATVAEW